MIVLPVRLAWAGGLPSVVPELVAVTWRLASL